MRKVLRLAPVLALLALPPAPVFAQAEVTALANGSDPVETTDALRISRFADLSEETTVKMGTRLELGDLLISVDDAIGVELTCGEDTILRFSGGFRLLVDAPAAPEGADCAVDLLSGQVDALTDSPVEIEAGNVTLGVEGTQFSVALARGEEGWDPDVSVYEGIVRVRAGSIEQRVETGRTWRLAKGESKWGDVTPARAERTASLFARLEVAKSVAQGTPVEDREKSYDSLRNLYFKVLTRPQDTDSRVELARTQLTYHRDELAAYHLRRADVTTEEQLDSYRLDKRVLEQMGRKLAGAERVGGAGLQRTGVQPAVDRTPSTGLTLRRDPAALIESGDYEAAIEILEEMAADQPTSRIYFNLAQAWAGLAGNDSAKARAYAGRALELQSSDGKLSATEIRWCRRMRAGAGR